MIPILYEKDETAFISNGLGRLREMISCVVTEERNGLYECDFEIAMSSEDFPLIQIGRIIGVTHEESDDIQPFDIVSYERPIEGVVKFHAVHISYRQSYMTVTGSNINSLADAFTLFGNAQPSNPFSYETDKTSIGYMSSADGLPKTVRSMLGGIEGSVLDTYGGEYEWDKFRVILHEARGQQRNFQIRYGVNMVDYEEECDIQGSYSSCVPYWTDGTDKVVGDKQDSGMSTITGRGETVPLDVSDKFDSDQGQPTKAQVEAMGLSVMNSKSPYLPVQNIHVEFVRLQDMSEYQGFSNLLQCKLCDTIQVVFPDYNSSGWFKIVKTTWNVLRDRYESMELGDLSMSLSEALGITNALEKASAYVEPEDYIVDRGIDGIWTYIKYRSGDYHAWYVGSINLKAGTALGGGYYHQSSSALNPPSFSTAVSSLNGSSNGAQLYAYVGHAADYSTYWWNGASGTASNIPIRLDMYGTWSS